MQLLFPGFEPIPKPRHRVFLALFPDAPAAERIVERAHCLRDELALNGVPFPATRLHVSLLHLGDHPAMPQAVVKSAAQALNAVVAPPFDIVFDQRASFSGRGPRPFVLFGGEGVAALKKFQATLVRALSACSVRGRRSYTPHMTLFYDHRRIAARTVEPIGWTVRDVALVHRVLSSDQLSSDRGYESATLTRWTLRG